MMPGPNDIQSRLAEIQKRIQRRNELLERFETALTDSEEPDLSGISAIFETAKSEQINLFEFDHEQVLQGLQELEQTQTLSIKFADSFRRMNRLYMRYQQVLSRIADRQSDLNWLIEQVESGNRSALDQLRNRLYEMQAEFASMPRPEEDLPRIEKELKTKFLSLNVDGDHRSFQCDLDDYAEQINDNPFRGVVLSDLIRHWDDCYTSFLAIRSITSTIDAFNVPGDISQNTSFLKHLEALWQTAITAPRDVWLNTSITRSWDDAFEKLKRGAQKSAGGELFKEQSDYIAALQAPRDAVSQMKLLSVPISPALLLMQSGKPKGGGIQLPLIVAGIGGAIAALALVLALARPTGLTADQFSETLTAIAGSVDIAAAETQEATQTDEAAAQTTVPTRTALTITNTATDVPPVTLITPTNVVVIRAPSATSSLTPEVTETETASPTLTLTSTLTETPIPSLTPTQTFALTLTPSATASPTLATNTPIPTDTPIPQPRILRLEQPPDPAIVTAQLDIEGRRGEFDVLGCLTAECAPFPIAQINSRTDNVPEAPPEIVSHDPRLVVEVNDDNNILITPFEVNVETPVTFQVVLASDNLPYSYTVHLHPLSALRVSLNPSDSSRSQITLDAGLTDTNERCSVTNPSAPASQSTGDTPAGRCNLFAVRYQLAAENDPGLSFDYMLTISGRPVIDYPIVARFNYGQVLTQDATMQVGEGTLSIGEKKEFFSQEARINAETNANGLVSIHIAFPPDPTPADRDKWVNLAEGLLIVEPDSKDLPPSIIPARWVRVQPDVASGTRDNRIRATAEEDLIRVYSVEDNVQTSVLTIRGDTLLYIHSAGYPRNFTGAITVWATVDPQAEVTAGPDIHLDSGTQPLLIPTCATLVCFPGEVDTPMTEFQNLPASAYVIGTITTEQGRYALVQVEARFN